MRRIVVVGHGIAGLTAAEELRVAGFDGSLTIVGDEPTGPYSRPALSKAALLDEGEMVSHALPDASHGATVLTGRAVVGLDADRRVVRLDAGDALPYDGLVIATGSRAARLGGESSPELTVRSAADAVHLRGRLAGAPGVVVIGSGPLGMELASGCRARGCEVTLVSRGRPLSRLLGDHLGAAFTDAARAHGVRVLTTGATHVEASKVGATVTLGDGSTVGADLVVSAVGDRPNTEWLDDAGLLRDGLLAVDTRGRLSDRIVSAGDVAAFPTARGVRRVPLWTSAIDQAKVAAVALLRGDDAPELDFTPYFWTEGFGLSLKSSGWLPVVGPPDEVLAGTPEAGLLRWWHDDGTAAAVALDHRVPVPKLRRLALEPRTVHNP